MKSPRFFIYISFFLLLYSCSSLRVKRNSDKPYNTFPDEIFLGFLSNEDLESPMVVLDLKDSTYYLTTEKVLYNYRKLPFPLEETKGMYPIANGIQFWYSDSNSLNFVPGYTDAQLHDLVSYNTYVKLSSALSFESHFKNYDIFRLVVKPQKYLMVMAIDNVIVIPPLDSTIVDLVVYDEKSEFKGITVFTEEYKSNFYRTKLLPIFTSVDLTLLEYDQYLSDDKVLNMNPETSIDSLQKYLGTYF